MKLAILFSSAILAVSAAFAPQVLWAQDQRSETEAIVKDYLATHPDEVGEIVKAISSSTRKRSARSWPNCQAAVERSTWRRTKRSPITARPSPPTRLNSSLRPTR